MTETAESAHAPPKHVNRAFCPYFGQKAFLFSGVRMSKYTDLKKISVSHLRSMKRDGEKICVITAYDYTSAKLLDSAGVEVVLVGDSLGMVMHGYESTVPVSLDEMIFHAKMVRKGVKRSFMVVDMPYGTYHISTRQTLENCIRVIKETGAEAVKIEGGVQIAPLVKKLTSAGVNVMGHIGLTPQYVHSMGGYKIQGRAGHEQLVADAKALEEAGAFSIVVEGTVTEAAKAVTEAVSVPTIGIGAGVHCDGQVLVYHDMFGMFDDFVPSFVKQYANVKESIVSGAKQYCSEVKAGLFPTAEHSYK